jgi:DNA-directed RNA polymerase specialized sigma24 family protein
MIVCRGLSAVIRVETNPILIEKIREKDMKYIIDWFDTKKELYYTIACTYLKSPLAIEDLFYRVIMKIYDENRKLRKNINFDTWIISIILNECRELGNKKIDESLNVSENELLNNLAQLESNYKDSILLFYLLDFTHDEVANILQIPIETVRSNLITGIKLLSNDVGVTIQNTVCREYQDQFIDYLDWMLDRDKKIELEIHNYSCQSCQTVLGSLQDVIITLRESEDMEVPPAFIDNITAKVNETMMERYQIKKNRTKKSIVAASVVTIAIIIGFFTNGFSYLYYSWLDFRQAENEQMLAYLKSGLGESLNIEDESNGIKVKIKTAIADEYQTLVYFEVEDTNEESNKYTISVYDGVYVDNESELMNPHAFPISIFPTEQLSRDKKGGNVFSGRFSLLPISAESGTIQLRLSKLLKVKEDPSNPEATFYNTFNEMEMIAGEWSFDIPVTKHASVEQIIDEEIEVEGIPINMEKITFSPTTSVLQYSFNPIHEDKHINAITIDSLERGKEIAQAHAMQHHFRGDGLFQSTFESLYFEESKNVKVQFSSIFSHTEDNVTFELNEKATSPQTFEYLGNTISIENITDGDQKKVIFIDAPPEDRAYESLHFEFKTEKDEPLFMSFNSSDGVLIDRDGNIYEQEDYYYLTNIIEQPRYYQTKIDIELFKEASNERVFANKFQIHGYSTTTYTDEMVEISLN